MSKFYNITGSTGVTVELISPTETIGGIKSILLTNLHDSNDATISLFIEDDPASGTTSTYNLIYNVLIPPQSSLLLNESSMFRFPEEYGFYITVGGSDVVDVIIS